MRTPKERLSHLLELAAKGAEQRAALAGEVAELLHNWPAAYPAAMRANFEALLERIAREVSAAGRRELARRFEGRSDASLALLNELFLNASDVMKDEILALNEREGCVATAAIDSAALLAAARTRGDFPVALAQAAAIPRRIAAEIMADVSCRSLAVVAKGAGLSRSHFSAVAVLTIASANRSLAAFQNVPAKGAANLLAFWRAKLDVSLASRDAA